MDTYNDGDRVVLEHEDGSRLVREVEHSDDIPGVRIILPKGHWMTLARLASTGWRVTSHTPKVTLPTDEGAYADREGKVWYFEGGDDPEAPSWWSWREEGGWRYPARVVHYAPFTRLVPESEVVARVKAGQCEVVDWLTDRGWLSVMGGASEARQHFDLYEDGAE